MNISYFIKDVFFNNNICLLGVDGTGKSSIINKIYKQFNEKYNIQAEVQYMGYRNYLTKSIKKIEFNKSKNKFKNIIYILIEMWYRVIRHWGSGKIIIYDRYFWDGYLNLKGKKRVIAKILFRYLFPKPKNIFYLYCSVDTSLKRKDDIKDIELFKKTKYEFDKEFLMDKNILKINTDLYDIDYIVDIIINKIFIDLK